MRKSSRAHLVQLVRSASPDVILAVAQLCDGHSILDPQAFINAGLVCDVVEHLTVTHRSDLSHPKSTIFVHGEPVKELAGVYGLRMLEFLAEALGVDYPRCLGRGFQARAIQQALAQHVNKGGAADSP